MRRCAFCCRGYPFDAALLHCRYVRGVSNWNFNIEDIKAEAGGSDSKDSPRSSLGGASSAEGKVQHKGRFDVYDSDSTATSTISAATEVRSAAGRCLTRYDPCIARRAPSCARGALRWLRTLRCARNGESLTL